MKYILIIWFYSWSFYANVGVPATAEFNSLTSCQKAGNNFMQSANEKQFHFICAEK